MSITILCLLSFHLWPTNKQKQLCQHDDAISQTIFIQNSHPNSFVTFFSLSSSHTKTICSPCSAKKKQLILGVFSFLFFKKIRIFRRRLWWICIFIFDPCLRYSRWILLRKLFFGAMLFCCLTNAMALQGMSWKIFQTKNLFECLSRVLIVSALVRKCLSVKKMSILSKFLVTY